MKTTTTTFTCDRCRTSKTYEHANSTYEERAQEWAEEHPASVSRLDGIPVRPYEAERHVCTGCLTDDERRRLAEQQFVDGEIPF